MHLKQGIDKMKNIINLIIVFILLTGCSNREDKEVPYLGLKTTDSFKNSIVYNKTFDGNLFEEHYLYFDVKTDSGFYKIKVYGIEWDKFEIGDTIK